MKNLTFEIQDINNLILETENSLIKLFPQTILNHYKTEFCER